MAVRYNGRVYYYVDTIVVDEIIYDVFEDNHGHTFTRVVGTTY